MKRFLPVLLLASAVGLVHAQNLREEFHQTYPLSPNGRVILKNVNGGVRITAWDRAEVKVDAVKQGRTQQELDEARIEINAGGDMIDIRTRYPEEERRNSASVNYTLMVPRTAVLDNIGTVNGTVEIEGITGPVKASSVNGDVRARGASGDMKLKSVNGRVEAAFDRIEGREVSLDTVNGGVEVALPAGTGAQLNASTVHGDISSDFDLPIRRASFGPGTDIKTTIGAGGPDLRLKTVNGSISLRRR
jgi:DUF4097 and DUF4098 domain-containing protein YvlB